MGSAGQGNFREGGSAEAETGGFVGAPNPLGEKGKCSSVQGCGLPGGA